MTRTGPYAPLQPFPQPFYLKTDYNWDAENLKGKVDRRQEIMERVTWDNEWMRLSALCCQFAREDRAGGPNCPACSGAGYVSPDEKPEGLYGPIAGTEGNKRPIYLCECARRHWPEDQLPDDVTRAKPLQSWTI